MMITYGFPAVAVTVRRWFEVGADATMEAGARIEIALREPQPHRGTESAAQRVVVDRTFWRADIFGRLDEPGSPYGVAHFHPRFDGDEPSERHWDPDLTDRPWHWLDAQLGALGQRLADAGLDPGPARHDADDLRRAAPLIVAAAQRFGPENRLDRDENFRLTRDAAHRVAMMVELARDVPTLDTGYVAPWVEHDRAHPPPTAGPSRVSSSRTHRA